MQRQLLATSLLLVSQSFAAEPTTQPEWSGWEITLERTDSSGRLLSQAKAPLAVYKVGDFMTQLVINMGTGASTRLWTVECSFGGEGDRLLKFEVSDTTRITSWTTAGSENVRAAELFDVETSWHGAGQYLVFTMDDETLTADIHPVAGPKTDSGMGDASTVIIVTRRSSSGKILSQTTAPWPTAGDNPDSCQLLAIQSGMNNSPHTLLVRCWSDMQTLRFRTEALIPIKEELGGTQARRLLLNDTRVPINAAGKYLIQELNRETLEAEIRSAGKAKTAD